MRPSFDETYLKMAEILSHRATCPRRQVGAIAIAADNTLVGGGYNGAPRDMPHCTDVGCLIKDDHCVRVIHAESNALWYCDHSRLVGGVLYLYNAGPCLPCVQKIIRAGIVRVTCRLPKGTYDDDGWRHLREANIAVDLWEEDEIEPIEPSGLVRD